MLTKRRIVGLAIVGATLLGAACSSDSTSSDSTSATTGGADTAVATSPTAATTATSEQPSTAPSTAATDTSTAATAAAADDSFSVAAKLAELPASVYERATGESGTPVIDIFVSDLDLASEMGGLQRPPRGSLGDEFLDWLYPITGLPVDEEFSPVFALMPEAANIERFKDAEQIRDEVGWTVSDVGSFIEFVTPPNRFTVLEGDFSDETMTATLGEAVDGVWRIGGEDNEIAVAENSPARPLGEALRFALHDDQLAIARSTPPVEDWLALHATDGTDQAETFADQDGLIAVATALDEIGVYSAYLAENDFGFRPQLGTIPSRTAPDGGSNLGQFTTVGIGQRVDDDGTRVAVFAYYYEPEGAAEDVVDALTALLTEGVSIRNQAPWSESFDVRDVAATDHVLTAVVELTDFRPGSVWSLLSTRENLFTAG